MQQEIIVFYVPKDQIRIYITQENMQEDKLISY